MTYSVVLEEGSGGGFMAWVVELPGCFSRAPTRREIEEKLPAEISGFLHRHSVGSVHPNTESIDFEIVLSLSTKEDTADGGTSVLLDADRAPLSRAEWRPLESWLDNSREDLLAFLEEIRGASLDWTPEGSPRSLQQSIYHLAYVELMYAFWTFDHRSREGLQEFLAWTRRVALDRLRDLADRADAHVTLANWSGAAEPEEWTARKAARRLIWHERLHLRSMKRRFYKPSVGDKAPRGTE